MRCLPCQRKLLANSRFSTMLLIPWHTAEPLFPLSAPLPLGRCSKTRLAEISSHAWALRGIHSTTEKWPFVAGLEWFSTPLSFTSTQGLKFFPPPFFCFFQSTTLANLPRR